MAGSSILELLRATDAITQALQALDRRLAGLETTATERHEGTQGEFAQVRTDIASLVAEQKKVHAALQSAAVSDVKQSEGAAAQLEAMEKALDALRTSLDQHPQRILQALPAFVTEFRKHAAAVEDLGAAAARSTAQLPVVTSSASAATTAPAGGEAAVDAYVGHQVRGLFGWIGRHWKTITLIVGCLASGGGFVAVVSTGLKGCPGPDKAPAAPAPQGRRYEPEETIEPMIELARADAGTPPPRRPRPPSPPPERPQPPPPTPNPDEDVQAPSVAGPFHRLQECNPTKIHRNPRQCPTLQLRRPINP